MALAPGRLQWLPLPYGTLREFLHEPLGFQMQGRARYGDVMRLRLGPMLIHFLYHPDEVRRVLYSHQKNYLRGWHYRLLHQLFGDNLIVSEGDHWRRQRRLAQPAFQHQRLHDYAAIMTDATCQLLSRWEEATASGQALDVGPEMAGLALTIAGRTLFDRDVSGEADVVGQSFGVISEYLRYRFDHPFTALPTRVPTTANRRFYQAAGTLNQLVLALIRERRSEGRDHGDLLSMLMQARDEETGEGMTDDQLRSEALAFLIAGHETTATGLTWVCYCLASHPLIQQQVRAEIAAVCGEHNPSLTQVLQLDITRRVVEESLRLYPPIWAVSRQVVADDEVGGFHLPANSTVMLSPFVTHRHPDIWPEPDVFDPERFSPERVAARPKCAYFPFLGGPHQCIGNEFAMLEMRLIVALVMQRFHLELLPDQAIRPVASLTLRPNGKVWLRLTKVNEVKQ